MRRVVIRTERGTHLEVVDVPAVPLVPLRTPSPAPAPAPGRELGGDEPLVVHEGARVRPAVEGGEGEHVLGRGGEETTDAPVARVLQVAHLCNTPPKPSEHSQPHPAPQHPS